MKPRRSTARLGRLRRSPELDYRIFRGRGFRGFRGGRGFVLVLTLVLIALAAVVLAATARRSLAAALDATGAAEDLQRRWAQVSLETVLLPRTEQMIVDAEIEADHRLRSVAHAIRLGSMDVMVTVTDEQASVNVNALLASRPRHAVEPALTALLRAGRVDGGPPGVDAEPLRLRLRPGDGRLTGYEQVFDRPAPRQIVAMRPPVTCWGNGRLNWLRADEASMRTLLEPEVGAGVVGRLIEARDDTDPTLDQAIAQLPGVSSTVRRKLQSRLTDRSACHGLWIVVSNGHRSWFSLTVAERRQAADRNANAQAAPQSHRMNW